jgi:uncharacterized protein (DUF2236 family)
MLLWSRKKLAAHFEPHDDYGFFGPDSVTWKVWSYPTTFLLGFVRATSIEYLDPNLAAAAMQSGGVAKRTHNRYNRTVAYFALGILGGAGAAVKASDVLVKIHSKAIGHDPVTGGTYDANDPSSQLWIHMTAWHSILKAYEEFGPGKLTEAEELQYWEECAISAALTTADPADVPRTRDEVRAYFAAWRPRLAISEDAQAESQMILNMIKGLKPDLNPALVFVLRGPVRMIRQGVIRTYPRHIQDMLGVKPNPLLAPFAKPFNRVLFAAIHRSLRFTLWFADLIAPAVVPIGAPAILGIAPKSDKVWDPREAQAHFGVDLPAVAHPAFRAKQHDKVFAKGEKPLDDGLLESQKHWGDLEGYNYA